jgi:hypothetical protein
MIDKMKEPHLKYDGKNFTGDSMNWEGLKNSPDVDFKRDSVDLVAKFRNDFDRRILSFLYEYLGSEPTKEKAKKHGEILVRPDGESTLTWKGIPIVSWKFENKDMQPQYIFTKMF